MKKSQYYFKVFDGRRAVYYRGTRYVGGALVAETYLIDGKSWKRRVLLLFLLRRRNFLFVCELSVLSLYGCTVFSTAASILGKVECTYTFIQVNLNASSTSSAVADIMARIFLIDENHNTRIALRAALQTKGYAVDIFDKPEIALRHFSTSKYDVAIIAARIMPSTKSGLDVVRMIYDADKNTRIVLMSESNLNKEYLEESGVVSKIDAFMIRPRGTVKLVSHIEALLKIRRQELAGLITFAVTSLIALSSESGIIV